jgi:hypothetical protein
VFDKSATKFTGVVTDGTQRAVVAGQVGSPPPVTLALFVTLGTALIVGVTGITKFVFAPAASPNSTVHVTSCPRAVQFAGNNPIVNPSGIVSVIIESAVVGTMPVFVKVKV